MGAPNFPVTFGPGYRPATHTPLLRISTPPVPTASRNDEAIVLSDQFMNHAGPLSLTSTESPAEVPLVRDEIRQEGIQDIQNIVTTIAGSELTYIQGLQELHPLLDWNVLNQDAARHIQEASASQATCDYWVQDTYADLSPSNPRPFEISQALHKLAIRYAPQVNIDMTNTSQSFVVTDMWQPDMPIIYASYGFETMTGYSREEVLGRNCRFLQSRKGDVKPGASREFVSSASVYELKEKIALGQEVQHVIMNFRKSGEPLKNLLSLVPIPWDTMETRFWFGFQTDLSQNETPLNLSLHSLDDGSLLRRRKFRVHPRESSTSTNHELPVTNGSDSRAVDTVSSATATSPVSAGQVDDIADVNPVHASDTFTALLASLGASDLREAVFETSAWNNLLLHNADELIQVLSLKGTVVYISPACQQLGYNSTLLLGSSIGSICHPSDELVVLRELKNASVDKEIDMIFRIRQHSGGYAWYHNYGSVWAEGGRKWAILVARRLDVFSLSKQVLGSVGGLGVRDIWMKLSTSGLVLSVFPNPLQAFGIPADKLVGTSFQDMMDNGDDIGMFKHLLNEVRTGEVIASAVAMRSARGHRLDVELTLHPGDREHLQSCRPYFMFAQCRFIKIASSKNNSTPSHVTPKWSIKRYTSSRCQDPDDNLLAKLEANQCGVWHPHPTALKYICEDKF
ncbi:hypothetical protein TruAng_007793 [Truncatella angustata]|nr:hypothetical protein TruAng_007793 [Truncatella angustata]